MASNAEQIQTELESGYLRFLEVFGKQVPELDATLSRLPTFLEIAGELRPEAALGFANRGADKLLIRYCDTMEKLLPIYRQIIATLAAKEAEAKLSRRHGRTRS